MPEIPEPNMVASPKTHTAHWITAVLLAFIAGVLWSQAPHGGVPQAFAQNSALMGARGVYAFTGQLDQNSFGLFMLDIEQGTVWCYELDRSQGHRQLRLIAARSWVYDRYLHEFNCAEPTYEAVQELVELQRKRLASGGSADPDGQDNDETDRSQEPRAKPADAP